MNGTFARIVTMASYLPEKVLDNHALAELYPQWSAEKIFQKTGIRARRVAAADETAADLAVGAANRLFRERGVARESIDFLIFCTQAPDYFLPTSACLIQERLGLQTNSGALDINLGCSGYVYGLSLAKGLIESGSASRVLLLTADTYSKFIHPLDKSVRTLFGDGAAATLIEAVKADSPWIGPFVFGTDGSGANNLIVRTGGLRHARTAASAVEYSDSSGNIRSEDNLFMDGAAIMSFTLSMVPRAVEALAAASQVSLAEVDWVVLHQANSYMLEGLRKKMRIPAGKFVLHLEECGNTVSSTIPIALEHLLQTGRLQRGQRLTLVGFGVGYSWAAAAVTF